MLGDGYSQPIAPNVSLSFQRRLGSDGLEGVTIRDGRFGDAIKFVFAEHADFLRPAEIGGQPALLLHRGSYRTLDATGDVSPPVDFDELIFAISEPSGLSRARGWRGHYEEHIWRLLDPPAEVSADPDSRATWLAEGRRRIVLPLLCPSLAIFALGTVLACGQRRQDTETLRLPYAVGGVCAWYGSLIAADAVAGGSSLVTLTYYGLAILPAAAGLLMLAWGSSGWRRGAMRLIARLLFPRLQRPRRGSCAPRQREMSGFDFPRFAMVSPMDPTLRSVGTLPLRWLVHAIDAVLRRILVITEIESDTDSVFRVKVGRAEREILLSDGTRVRPGDTVLELHLWNEKLEPASGERSELGWAVRLRRQFLTSLQRLATHVQRDPKLRAVRAIYMQPAIERQKPPGSIERMLPKVGFEPVRAAAPAPGLVYRFLENAWLWLLTWAHNPQALRGRHFDRTRRGFWISRSKFLARYAGAFVVQREPAGADLPAAVRVAMREKSAALSVEGGAE